MAGIQKEAGQRLIEFCQENTLVIAKASSNNIRKDNHGHHHMGNTEIRLIIFSAAKDGEALHNQHARPGADCGSAHEFLIAKFRLKLKKVARPFRYDLNQIPYDYTMEVTNRFKGIDLVDRMPEELGTEVHNTVHKAVTKTIPKNKKCKAQ